MEMDPLAVVLPQFALDDALAANEARHEAKPVPTQDDAAAPQTGNEGKTKAP